ncbi:TPA: hypothetical protein ACQJXC_000576, partial [Raoultella ornithinolytica]
LKDGINSFRGMMCGIGAIYSGGVPQLYIQNRHADEDKKYSNENREYDIAHYCSLSMEMRLMNNVDMLTIDPHDVSHVLNLNPAL